MKPQYKNATKSLIVKAILSMLIIWLVFGCAGARKTSKYQTEKTETKSEVTTVIDTSKTTTTTDTNTKIIENTDISDFEISPIDNTKEMVVEGKVFKNAILKRKATKVNKVVELTEKVSKNEENGYSASNKKDSLTVEKEVKKESSRISFNLLWLLLLLIPIGGYLYWRKGGFKFPF